MTVQFAVTGSDATQPITAIFGELFPVVNDGGSYVVWDGTHSTGTVSLHLSGTS